MSVSTLSEALADKNLKAVSERSGVSYHTVRKIANEPESANPRVDCVHKLQEYLGINSQIVNKEDSNGI